MDQLVLPLQIKPLYRFDNLIVHEGNELAVSTITSVYLKKDNLLPNLFLYGPGGTGKTHVLVALAEALRSHMPVTFISAHRLSKPQTGEEANKSDDQTKIFLNDPQPVTAFIIDDVQEIAAEYASTLWNISNKLTTAGLPLILSSIVSPRELFEDNLHLRSRVASGLVLRLDNPSDSERMLVLDKIARDRNVRLPPEVARYLVNHKSRGIRDLTNILESLDVCALTKGRRITLPFIRELEKEGVL